MSILDDGKPVPVSRFAGQVDYQGPQKVINGCAVLARNAEFAPDFVKTRFGTRTTMARQQTGGDVTSIDVLEVLGLVNPGEVPVCFTTLGELLQESPTGSGAFVPLTPPYTLPANARMQTTQADNSLFMGFDDGENGLLPPIQYMGQTKQILPISPNTIGALWQPGIIYRAGDLVRSVDGRWWHCFVAATGLSTSVSPPWPEFNGGFVGPTWYPATVTDVAGGDSEWEEWTPNCTNLLVSPDTLGSNANVIDNPGAGTIAANKDIYIELTYVIPGVGETAPSPALVFIDTANNDQIIVQISPSAGKFGGPLMPRWMAEIILQPAFFAPFFVNIYVAEVATGAAPPANSAYNLYDKVTVGTQIVISSVAASPGAPESPSAAAGNYTNPGNAYDGNLATASTAAAAGFAGHTQAFAEVWSGFSGRGAGATGLALNVDSSFQSVNGGDGYLEYSLDAGVTFNYIYNVRANRAQTIDVIPLSNTQDLTKVQVRAGVSAGGGSGVSTADQSVYEIWIAVPGSLTNTVLPTPTIVLLTPNQPAAFRGSNGPRYMIVGRINPQGSLAPIDSNSAIPITIQGTVTVNILQITRDSSGNVKATVIDISQFAPGQGIQVIGCTGIASLNGSFVLTAVTPTLAPEGVLAWVDLENQSDASDDTGAVELPPSSPPVAFLPIGGPEDSLDIAAFTVVNGSQDGPFSYIAASDPAQPVSATIVNVVGEGEVESAITAITRYQGGETVAAVSSLAGFAIGQSVTIADFAVDPSFNEQVVLTSVVVGTGAAGTIGYVSADTEASSDSNGTATTTVEPGAAVVTVLDSTGIVAGQVVAIENSSIPSFNQIAVVAQVTGSVVTLSMTANGTSLGGQMVVQQNLPTTAPSGVTSITSITRDASGNVLAQIANLGEWEPGHLVNVSSVTNATFEGLFQVETAALNPDGLSGVLGWTQSGQAVANSAGGTVNSVPDVVINFDDAALEGGFDITSQLASLGAPNCSDLYFVPSLAMMAYVDNNHFPSAFLFSNPQDPANITGDSGDDNNPGSGILSVDANSQKKAIGVREMRSGEVLLIKENGGFKVENSALYPSNWNPSRRWDEFGPVCAEAMALSNSDESDFLAFASEYGAFVYMGGTLTKLSREIGETWKRFNLAAKQTAACGIDVERRVIHFLLPLDGASTPNYELTMSYYDGWGPPEVLNRYGKLITARACRKWSIQPLSARTVKYVHRAINGVVPGYSIGGQAWAYAAANEAGGFCTFTFANAAAVPPLHVNQLLYSALTGIVTVTAVTATTVITLAGTAGAGAHPAGSLNLVTQVQAPSSDQRVATKQLLYGQAGATTPLGKLNITKLARAGGVVTAIIALGGYAPTPSELLSVIVSGALDTSFNGTFAVMTSLIVGQVLTLTWVQALPASTSVGILFTTLSMTRVTMIIPDVYDDDGVGIDFQYEPWLTQALPAELDYLGFRGSLGGSGFATLIPTAQQAGVAILPPRPIQLAGAIGTVQDPSTVVGFEEPIRYIGQYCGGVITNGAMPGCFAIIHGYSMYVQEWAPSPRVIR